jgi:thiosulfate dehydrogenase (quinone) large subunit
MYRYPSLATLHRGDSRKGDHQGVCLCMLPPVKSPTHTQWKRVRRQRKALKCTLHKVKQSEIVPGGVFMSYQSKTSSPFLRATIAPDHPPSSSWRLRGVAVLRIVFGLVWAIDASFKWQPAFINSFTTYLTKALGGQPPAMEAWITFWLRVISIHPHFLAYLVAITETTIAVCLILGAFSNLVCGIGVLLALMIWSTAQGFGGPYGPGSTDIGVGIIYTLVFCGQFLTCAGMSYGVDRHLASRLGRWNFLASGPVKTQKHLSLPLFYVPVSMLPTVQVQQGEQDGDLLHRKPFVDSGTIPISQSPAAHNTAVSRSSRLEGIKRQRLAPLMDFNAWDNHSSSV